MLLLQVHRLALATPLLFLAAAAARQCTQIWLLPLPSSWYLPLRTLDICMYKWLQLQALYIFIYIFNKYNYIYSAPILLVPTRPPLCLIPRARTHTHTHT
jgi:hypothetical protein